MYVHTLMHKLYIHDPIIFILLNVQNSLNFTNRTRTPDNLFLPL